MHVRKGIHGSVTWLWLSFNHPSQMRSRLRTMHTGILSSCWASSPLSPPHQLLLLKRPCVGRKHTVSRRLPRGSRCGLVAVPASRGWMPVKEPSPPLSALEFGVARRGGTEGPWMCWTQGAFWCTRSRVGHMRVARGSKLSAVTLLVLSFVFPQGRLSSPVETKTYSVTV